MVTQLRSQLAARSWLVMAGAAAGLCFLGLWVLAAPGAGASTTGQRVVGAVYTQTNSPSGNSVVVFNRFANGKLKKRQSVPTGGKGSTQSVGCGPGCPILDSQTAVVVSKNGKFVAAINAGSDTVTSFRKTPSGLKRVSQVSSGGKMPESLALHGNLLYVLNVATDNGTTTGNIYGMRISSSGKLSPLGSSRPLANLAPPDRSADPRAMDFKPNGRVIVVTELAAGFQETGPPGRIDTFVIGSNGKAGPAVAHPSSDALPFGFAFDNRSHLVVSQVRSPAGNVDGSVSTYKVTDSGGVTPIDTKPSSGILPCWVAVSSDGRYAYLVNTGAGHPAPVTRFRVGSTGALTPLSPPAASRSGEFARTDAALSRGSTFLYVLAPKVGPGNASHIDEYRRTANGGLKFIGSTQPGANIGIGATGLAAR